MNKPPAPPSAAAVVAAVLATVADKNHAVCVVTGMVLGQLVLALAARHEGSDVGLLLALLMTGAGGASVALVLGHLHQQRWRGARRLPLHAWLLSLSAGALAAMAFGAG